MKQKMKRKALAILMSLVMAFTMMPLMTGTAYAASITVDGIEYNYDESTSTASVASRNGAVGEVTIPSMITVAGNNYTVTAIENSAFDRCGSLTGVEIPSTVTTIGLCAFQFCSNLDNVTIPNSVTSIGSYAFGQCSSLTNITIPSSVTSIEEWTFNGCSSLYEIEIPNSVTSIGNSAFADCSSLARITIPSSVTSIGKYAFSRCSSLKNINFLGCEGQWSNLTSGVSLGLASSVIINTAAHTWNTEWSTDGNNHWHECSICGAHEDEAAHSGGTATCKEKAKCETCNEEYGDLGQHKYGAWTKLNAAQHQKVCEHDKSHVIKENHKWDTGKVTKAATEKAEGVKTYTCTACKATKTETIPKLKPSIPKVSGTPLAKATVKNKSMTIGWNKIQGAAGYDIFFATCNHSGKKIACKNVKTIKGNKTFKWTKSGLKKGTAYKFYVRAYVTKNGKKTYVSKTPMFHAYTGNGTKNYTNAKSVTVNKTKVTLKKGKTFKIKAKVNKVNKKKKLMPKSHAPALRYMTSNKNVATVNSSVKITAKGKGTCVIYVYAHNGVSKQVKVTVN